MAYRIPGLVLALAVASGCVTPSIPIPPPEPERMTFSVDQQGGTMIFTYGAESNYSNAVVYLYNRSQRSGIITAARADGSVGPTQPFAAIVGDNLLVTFDTDETVVSTCVVIQPSGAAYPYCN